MGRRPAFLLGGGLTALGVLRSLGRHGIDVHVFTEGPDDITFHSRFASPVRLGQENDSSATLQRLISEASQFQAKPILYVVGDRNLLLACHNQELLSRHFDFVLPTVAAAETVVRKELFQAFASAHGLPVPVGWSPSSLDELEELARHLRFPLVLKPVRSADWQRPSVVAAQGRRKMYLVGDVESLLATWTRIVFIAGPPLLQEFVRGDDDSHYSYVSYRNRQGEELVGLCVQKLRLHPIHGGLAAFARVVRAPDLEEIGRRALDQLNYRGVASVCFKRDAVTGEARIFEINGRLPLVHGIFQLAGIDLPWLMYCDAAGDAHDRIPLPRLKGHWVALSYDIWAARDYRRAGELSYFAWVKSLCRARMVVEFDLRDLGPFLFVLRGLGRSVGAALVRRFRRH